MTNAPAKTGRASADNPGLADEWSMADRMNSDRPGPGEWVPWKAIRVDHTINPRADAHIEYDRVREYADVFYELPPIRVQRDTFTLIDGNHRLAAVAEPAVTSVAIRIEEVDIPDTDLREAAFDANRQHGIQLSSKERVAHLRYLIGKHGTEMTDAGYASACGLSVLTVRDHRIRLDARRQSPHSKAQSVVITTPIHETPTISTEPEVAAEAIPAHVPNIPGAKPAGYFQRGDLITDLGTHMVWVVEAKGREGVELLSANGTKRLTVGLTSPIVYRLSTVQKARPFADVPMPPVSPPDGHHSPDDPVTPLSSSPDADEPTAADGGAGDGFAIIDGERMETIARAVDVMANAVDERDTEDAYEVAAAMTPEMANLAYTELLHVGPWLDAFMDALADRRNGS